MTLSHPAFRQASYPAVRQASHLASHQSVQPARLLTELDHVRISNLLKQSNAASAEELEAVIDNAELVSSYDVPPSVVTMNTQVLIADAHSGKQSQLTLCYPLDADPAAGYVSVLSPVGTGLLGRAENELAQWMAPDGKQVSARILRVISQPENSGDFLR